MFPMQSGSLLDMRNHDLFDTPCKDSCRQRQQRPQNGPHERRCRVDQGSGRKEKVGKHLALLEQMLVTTHGLPNQRPHTNTRDDAPANVPSVHIFRMLRVIPPDSAECKVDLLARRRSHATQVLLAQVLARHLEVDSVGHHVAVDEVQDLDVFDQGPEGEQLALGPEDEVQPVGRHHDDGFACPHGWEGEGLVELFVDLVVTFVGILDQVSQR